MVASLISCAAPEHAFPGRLGFYIGCRGSAARWIQISKIVYPPPGRFYGNCLSNHIYKQTWQGVSPSIWSVGSHRKRGVFRLQKGLAM